MNAPISTSGAIWQLDGGRAFHSLARGQRWLAAAAALAAWYAVSTIAPNGQAVGMLLILAAVAVFQAFAGKAAKEPDTGALSLYVFLIAALSALTLIPVTIRP